MPADPGRAWWSALVAHRALKYCCCWRTASLAAALSRHSYARKCSESGSSSRSCDPVSHLRWESTAPAPDCHRRRVRASNDVVVAITQDADLLRTYIKVKSQHLSQTWSVARWYKVKSPGIYARSPAQFYLIHADSYSQICNIRVDCRIDEIGAVLETCLRLTVEVSPRLRLTCLTQDRLSRSYRDRLRACE